MPDLDETMASMHRPRKRKRASTDSHTTKYFCVVTPTPDARSGSTSSRNDNLNDGHVSDNDIESSDSDDDPEDAGPNQIEQPPGVQDDSGIINDLGLILRGTMTDRVVSRAVSGLTPGQNYTEYYKPS